MGGDGHTHHWVPQMLTRLRLSTFLVAVAFGSWSLAQDGPPFKYTVDQQLVIASFQLNVDRVKALLANGADPNARIGKHERSLFTDKWTLGTPWASSRWTPLLAVAESHRAPQPEKLTENTVEAREAALERLKAVDPKLIANRDRRRVAIAKLLIAAKANLDHDDGYGDTALSASVYNGFDDLSLLLISSNAELDTKTIYFDGEGDITPMHRATDTPKVLEAMIKRGANVNVADTSGDTPLHWAVRAPNVASVKLLIAGGAKIDAKDNEGRLPSYWCKTFGIFELPGDAEEKKEIAKLLRAASRK